MFSVVEPVSPAIQSAEVVDELAMQIFDHYFNLFHLGQVAETMPFFVQELTQLRAMTESKVWKAFCQSDFTRHPITYDIHQDPITYHIYSKPSRYSGDARLLDLMYNLDIPKAISDIGLSVWKYVASGPETASVRERRDLLAIEIDRVAAQCDTPNVLSVACGHLRECQKSQAVQDSVFLKDATFIGLDQDEQSIAEVERSVGQFGIKTVRGSVKHILQGKLDSIQYDLVYAAGLYDYLSDVLATRLTAKLFSMLRPGGKLLLANFTPESPSIGYMETFMDWHLIYRSSAEMEQLTLEIPVDEIATKQLSIKSNGCVVYLELIRGASQSCKSQFENCPLR